MNITAHKCIKWTKKGTPVGKMKGALIKCYHLKACESCGDCPNHKVIHYVRRN